MSEPKLCPYRQGFKQTTVSEWGPERYTTTKSPFPGDCLQDKCAMWREGTKRNDVLVSFEIAGIEPPERYKNQKYWIDFGYCGLAGRP